MKKFAFTLAEVLITLGIVGVVAAMTIPSLINKIKYHTYDNAKHRILNTVGEAGKILAIEGNINVSDNSEDFVKNYLSKKLSIVKMCDAQHLKDCGLSEKFYKSDGITEINMPKKMLGETVVTTLNGKGSAGTVKSMEKSSFGIVTANGHSLNLFYNNACQKSKNINVSGKYEYSQDLMCFMGIYDMNGLRGPNIVGKDIGLVGVFYPDETVRAVAVLPADKNYPSKVRWSEIGKACDSFGKDYRVPDGDELSLMALNGNLIGITGNWFWHAGKSQGIVLFAEGNRGFNNLGTGYLRCVRK